MPSWEKATGGLTPEEIALLRDCLLSTGEDADSGAWSNVPADVAKRALDPSYRVQGDPAAGERIFARQCVGCHGVGGGGGFGPTLSNPAFQEAATDGFIYATVAYGRTHAAMPSFLADKGGAYSEAQVRDLTAYVRSLAPSGAAGGKGATE
jgi:mono/diheme cytochrome c family protein